jgi:hypothetical protein
MPLTRTTEGYSQMLRDQHSLLKSAVEGFYEGHSAKAIEVAIRLRTLVHQTNNGNAALSFINPGYRTLTIYHKLPETPTAVFSVRTAFVLSGSGEAKLHREDFTSPSYALVPLARWWNEDYLIIGDVRTCKRQLVTDMSNTDGGAHIDEEVPRRYAAATEPGFITGSGDGAIRPNLARTTVAQAGNEMLEYLERHFADILFPNPK